jgi:hypothetical protein
MIKYENSTLKIYIRNTMYIKVFTDIDPSVDFVFPVNKIDRENSEKLVSQDKFEVKKLRLTGILLPVHIYLFGF